MALPGAPQPDDPDNPTHLPVQPDDAGLPAATPGEEEKEGPCTPPA